MGNDELGPDDELGLDLVKAVLKKKLLDIKYALADGADPNTIDATDPHDIHPVLQTAVLLGSGDAIKALLNKEGIKVDEPDNLGRTALMRAAEKGSYRVMNVLIPAGANVNAQDNAGEFVIMKALAIKGDQLARIVLSILFKAGVKMNVGNFEGKTVLALAKEQGRTDMVNFLTSKGATEEVTDFVERKEKRRSFPGKTEETFDERYKDLLEKARDKKANSCDNLLRYVCTIAKKSDAKIAALNALLSPENSTPNLINYTRFVHQSMGDLIKILPSDSVLNSAVKPNEAFESCDLPLIGNEYRKMELVWETIHKDLPDILEHVSIFDTAESKKNSETHLETYGKIWNALENIVRDFGDVTNALDEMGITPSVPDSEQSKPKAKKALTKENISVPGNKFMGEGI